MLHLTLTGASAGVPLCGCAKQAARARGDSFAHAMYTDMRTPGICPECRVLWQAADDAACVACEGTGRIPTPMTASDRPCAACNGTGVAP